MRQNFPSITYFLFSYRRTPHSHSLKPVLRRYLPWRYIARFSSTSSMHSPTDFKYKWIDDVERLERYQPGGYHPVHIGDVLADRYQVAHKLGYGTYSTIWLAHDMQQAASYVAVKISTANAPAHEVEALNILGRSESDNPGRAMIPRIRDQFELRGPYGCHRCYTTFPARSSVKNAQSCCFPIATARIVVAQLVLAVAYTHSRGFVHGDIHLGNVLFRLPSRFDQLSTDQLYKRFGEPRTEPVICLDGKSLSSHVPFYGTVPVWLGKHADQLPACEAHILLSDFGEVFSPAAQQRAGNECHAPLPVLPPEVVFELEKSFSFPADIWMLACAIWSVLGLRPLFDGTLATQDDIVSEQIDMLGLSSFPSEWFNRWQERHEYFDEMGRPQRGRSISSSLEDSFAQEIQGFRQEDGVGKFSNDETVAIVAMLRRMLVFRPEERVTAELLGGCEWMVNWGLPELEKIRRE